MTQRSTLIKENPAMPDPLPPHPLDEIAPILARWLAPYIAAELNIKPHEPDLTPEYDEETCRVFVSGIGDAVIKRAELFFFALTSASHDASPQLDSLRLARLLETDSPRNIASMLTTPLKRRAKALGLPVPWAEASSAENRTVWLDRDEIAGRMYVVLSDEWERRTPPHWMPDGTRFPSPAEVGPEAREAHSRDRLAKLAALEAVEDER